MATKLAQHVRSALLEAIRALGYSIRSYSGRGMDGRTCMAFTLSGGTSAAIGAAADIVSIIEPAEVREEVAAVFGRAHTDSMGLGMVVYFPGVAWNEPDDDDDSDDK